MIYLDNNATTRVDAGVREGMMPWLGERYGNPSSTHRFGQEARQAVEEGRVRVAGLLGCSVREVIFTSGGTESDNAGVLGLMTTRMPRKCIVTSTVEHSAIREPLGVLAKLGIAVEKIRVNRGGELDMGMLEEVLTRRGAEGPDGVSLVTMIWANNETGVMFDVVKVGELCRRFGVPLHVDGVQAVGKVRMKVSEMPVDVMSVSGHKFHGPKGVGALYVRRGVRWNPWVRGGPQELDRRGGTENVAGIVGMGLAAEMASKCLGDGTWERIGGLRDRLEAGILKRVEDAHVIGDAKRRAGNTTNVAFAGLEAEAILLLLSEREICASAGAACSSGSLEPSPVLRAMGVDDRIGHGAVRFSLSRFTTEAEVDEVLEVLPGVIRKLRATLPV